MLKDGDRILKIGELRRVAASASEWAPSGQLSI
jgi:hypothetical protein